MAPPLYETGFHAATSANEKFTVESLNLTAVMSGLMVLFVTLTHQPPAETPGHSEGGASRKLVVWSHERGCCLRNRGTGTSVSPAARGGARARRRCARLGRAGRERDKAAAAAERRMWLRAGRGGRGRALGPCNFKLRTP